MKHKVSAEEANARTFARRLHKFQRTEAPIEVDSAFGGLAIYKTAYIVKNPNPYVGYKMKSVPTEDGTFGLARWQTCEHVHFNAGIRSMGGRLFIMPSLINSDYTGAAFPAAVQLFFR